MNALQRHDRERLSDGERLIGIDEAGRGALAGPVVAGSCVLDRKFFDSPDALRLSESVDDSKRIAAAAREAQFTAMDGLRDKGLLDFEVASASVEEIETYNILGATRLAMRRAVEALAGRASGWGLPLAGPEGPLFAPEPVSLLVDGRPLKPFPYRHEGLVGGDGLSLAVAMASIAAKVTRDRWMQRLAESYPFYDFARHKGYGTSAHRAAIGRHGACPAHRTLFLRRVVMP
ncbi:MAG: ribonuclease HII [Opitutales bacterium]